ncbi:MAG: ABC transporter permease [Candidatus Eisenbacteria bacterium]|nr:ABC transporter permease [Candidatus Eisenbacteria bacterium]
MTSRRLLLPVVAAAIGLVAGALLAGLFGARPDRFLILLLGETLGSGYGIGQVLFKATPLIFTGLAVALPFRAGLFNIGAEGQMMVGGFAMALAGIHLASVPGPWLWLLCVAAAFLAGGIWGAIPGLLKARTGAHEVIVTILLNFVAAALVNYFLSRSYALPDTVRTATLGEGAWMARASDAFGFFRGSGLSTALPFALAAAIACDLLLLRSPLGFHWRILSGGLRRARYARLSPGLLSALSMGLAGAIAGVGSCYYVLGYKHYFEEGFTSGSGHVGIAVGLLARNRPAAIPVSALLFGVLSQGGLVVNQLVPRELVDVIVAAILMIFISLDARSREGGLRWISS